MNQAPTEDKSNTYNKSMGKNGDRLLFLEERGLFLPVDS
jgi:hypothetical protein